MKPKKRFYSVRLRKYVFWFAAILLVIILWRNISQLPSGIKWADWTGFGDYVSPTGEYYRAKTIWDLLELLVVPIGIAIVAWLLNKNERNSEREIATKREIFERFNSQNRQHQETLEAYFDRMSELLLERDLRHARREDEVLSIARTRTLAVLRNLDGERKGQVIHFLREANILSLVSLDGADLSGAILKDIDLSTTNLRKADLTNANLTNSKLVSSNLEGAKLSYANLIDADLRSSILLMAIMDNAILKKANLGEANLSAANMSNVNLTNASLIGANLCGANLSQAIICDAHLSLVKFGDANLKSAILSGAFIRESDLSKAKGLTSEQLSATKSLENTLLPIGL